MRTILAAASTIFILGSTAAWSGPIFDSNEWRQLTETTNVSWNEVDAICANDGLNACVGSVGSIDFTGWIWATQPQVQALFENALIGVPAPATFVSEETSLWAPASLTFFDVTRIQALVSEELLGLLPTKIISVDPRSGAITESANLAQMYDFLEPGNRNNRDFAATINMGTGIDSKNDSIGVWLFRDASVTAVPEPGTIGLLGFGFAAAIGLRRRKDRLRTG